MGYRLGIDIGGTFTDFTVVDERGRLLVTKVPSVPQEPSLAIAAGLTELSRAAGVSVASFLAACDLVIHGSTVATNALIELKGARTGLLCTKGFRDSLEIRLSWKEKRYDFRYAPPPVLVPRYLRLPVEERITKEGAVRVPLSEDDVRAHIRFLKDEGVESVAVSFLWSFLNAAHERRVGEIFAAEWPEADLSLSVDVCPQIREYDRTSTTVLNAYVAPVVKRYVASVERFFGELGYRGPVRYMQLNGGVASGEEVARKAVLALNSGPAAAPTAGLFFAGQLGRRDLLTVDMGGTSFDVCLVRGGMADTLKNADVCRYRLALPAVNINSIGAGGGSLAWIDPGGILRVGPQSAAAFPGPACYGRGGVEPTVTDANVVLGYLGPDAVLGGTLRVDDGRARRAIESRIAGPLGLDLTRASLGIFNVVNNNMVQGIGEASVQRGHDPRDFILVAGGGCGPVHAGRLARDLGISTVIVPRSASTLCAFGEAAADLKHDVLRPYISPLPAVDAGALEEAFRRMEAEGRRALAAEGVSPGQMDFVRSMDIRYVGQIYEVTVTLPPGAIASAGLSAIADLFHQRHEKLYTYCERDNAAEVVGIGVSAIGRGAPIILGAQASAGRHMAQPPRARRDVYFEEHDGYVPTPVYVGAALAADSRIVGPAVIEEDTTSVVVFPGTELRVDPRGFFLMQVSEE